MEISPIRTPEGIFCSRYPETGSECFTDPDLIPSVDMLGEI
jgi:hypothetical protein